MTAVEQRPVAASALQSVRTWLALDAAITGLCGALYLAAAPVVVDLMGSTTGTMRSLGAFLLAFAALVALAARPARPPGGAVPAIVAVNVVWVVASVVVAVAGALDLDGLGRAWAVAQAAVVAVLALQQWRTR
jgi:hypothetical protein